jgi:integrase
MRFLSPEQVADLVAVMPAQYRALVVVGAYEGLRFGEIAALRRRDIDLIHKEIKVVRSAVDLAGAEVTFEQPKTNRSEREVPLFDIVIAEIEQHLAEHVGPGADGLVFTAAPGGPIRRGSFRRVWSTRHARRGSPASASTTYGIAQRRSGTAGASRSSQSASG